MGSHATIARFWETDESLGIVDATSQARNLPGRGLVWYAPRNIQLLLFSPTQHRRTKPCAVIRKINVRIVCFLSYLLYRSEIMHVWQKYAGRVN